jgi:hypothetical protein
MDGRMQYLLESGPPILSRHGVRMMIENFDAISANYPFFIPGAASHNDFIASNTRQAGAFEALDDP